jgi:DNA-binding transcriptional MocR family regulator
LRPSYQATLLLESARQRWALPGNRTRYGKLADLIARQISGGIWRPGQQMPSERRLAARYGEQRDTAEHALHVLAVRGYLALDHGEYYVLPAGTAIRPAALPLTRPRPPGQRRLLLPQPGHGELAETVKAAACMRKCACGPEFQTLEELKEHLAPRRRHGLGRELPRRRLQRTARSPNTPTSSDSNGR